MEYIGTQKPRKNSKKPAHKRYKHCTAEEAQQFKRANGVLTGGIHTASFFLPGVYLIADQLPPDRANREISSLYTNRGGTTMKFNPNKYRGACESMDEYQWIKETVLMNLRYEGVCETNRVDFKIDSNPPPQACAFWEKVCDLFVYAFMEYKGIKVKGRERTTDPFTGLHKQTKGSTKGFEFVHYNKAVQKPAEGVGHRIELRRKAMNDSKSRNRLGELDAINSLKQVVAALPAYYESAVSMQLERLCAEYGAIRPTATTPRSPAEFLRARGESVFNRQQVAAFAEKINIPNPARFSYNFAQRNPAVVFVSQSDLVKLCAVIGDMLDAYLQGTAAHSIY